jgi:hypothetical protein
MEWMKEPTKAVTLKSPRHVDSRWPHSLAVEIVTCQCQDTEDSRPFRVSRNFAGEDEKTGD